MRPKLSIPAQIKDMKEAGITFDNVSEVDARRYLEQYTYYFRIKAYAKNYEKYIGTEKQGQYINLDFAYLVDLAEIDSRLKKIILDMAFDIEHFLKVKLLSDFNTTYEDGYEIILDLFAMQPELCESIADKTKSPHCSDLIKKYKDEWALWNIVEVLTFGQFITLYRLFYARNNFKNTYISLLLPVNMIRNAAAHNNCLINRLRPPYGGRVSPCYELRNELLQNTVISKSILEKRLSHPAINDFSALLYLYSLIVPAKVRESSTNKLTELFNNRIPQNKEYYVKNESLRATYGFVLNVLHCFIDN